MTAHSGVLQARFRLCFARDYHVGAGHGEGTGLDAALFTDFGGDREEPAIRYGHGILRQAVYDLLAMALLAGRRRCGASDGAKDPQSYCIPRADGEAFAPCPVCRIFGSAAHPSPWRFSTLRPVRDGSAGPRAGVRTVSRAAIDLDRRRARDRTLFAEELGTPLEFEMVAERALDDLDAALDELAMLVAASATVAGVGADRRRGRGECALVLHACEGVPPGTADATDALLRRFESAWLGDAPADARHVARSARGSFAAPVSAGAWIRAEGAARRELRLVARLSEPVIAGGRALTGNLLDSEPYVPGTLLLGALAARVLAEGSARDETEFLRLFRAGGVSFPDLVPTWEDGESARLTLPAPLDLLTCGLHEGLSGHGVWSTLRREGKEAARCPRCGEAEQGKPKRLAGSYLVATSGTDGVAYRVVPATREETKIQIDPRHGRVLERSLYHRQTIPAGALLAGRLLADSAAFELLRSWGLFAADEGEMELRLGKRHRRGYGAVKLAWSALPPPDAADASERVESLLTACGAVPVVLASRTVLRDGLGRFRRTLRPADLGAALGASADEAGVAVRAAGVGGFWTHVGLPRAQGFALVPGSVIWLKPREDKGAAFASALAELATGAPIGERTAEGFGRVEVAPFPHGWTLPAPEPPDGGATPGADPAYQAFALPSDLRPHAPAVRLRYDEAGEWFRKYVERVGKAGLNAADDEWRTVARILYARAGHKAGMLIRAVTQGGGMPRLQISNAHTARDPKPFVTKGKGKDAWSSLQSLIREAASRDLSVEERALRTRALADALAAGVNPGKGPG